MASNRDDVSVGYVKVAIGYKTKEGIKEVVHEVSSDDYDMTNFTFVQDRKFKPTKDEEGNPLGFEPTGEYSWALKIKYIAPQE